MKYSKYLKGMKNLGSIEAMNVVLERFSVEQKTNLPIKDLKIFERCIRKRNITFQYPFQDCPISKQYVPLLIKSVAHAFLVAEQYSIRELMRDNRCASLIRNDFDLYDEDFYEFWFKCSQSVRDYVEKCAQFYVDAFYSCCIKEIPISSIHAKWVGANNAEIYYNDTLNEHYLRLL